MMGVDSAPCTVPKGSRLVPMIALADFVAQDAKEISFRKAATVQIRIFDHAPSGWWYAEHHGQLGLVPQTYFRKHVFDVLRPLPQSQRAVADQRQPRHATQ